MGNFVHHYNDVHHHSAIQFVTPGQRHGGEDELILAQRKTVYEQARARHPQRWSGNIRNLDHAGEVWLNPSAELLEPSSRDTIDG